MSRRSTYLLGGVVAVLGVALIAIAVVALTSGGGDSPSSRDARSVSVPQPAPATAPAPGQPGGTARKREERPGVQARGGDIGKQLSRRRPVQAPDFSAEVIRAGVIPQPLSEPFKQATGGGKLHMAKAGGTPVVLHLWAIQCAPCRADARLVEATWKRWGPRGVWFVGMHVKDSPANAKEVIRQYGLTYTAVVDAGGQIAGRYGATALPQTFFISAKGNIVGDVVGSPSVRQLEVGIAAARAGEPFGSEQGSARVPLR